MYNFSFFKVKEKRFKILSKKKKKNARNSPLSDQQVADFPQKTRAFECLSKIPRDPLGESHSHTPYKEV